jgi:hypothetical protein
MRRVELLSYGGGRQTVGLVALVREGRLPRPNLWPATPPTSLSSTRRRPRRYFQPSAPRQS